jgi:hypothetical protein
VTAPDEDQIPRQSLRELLQHLPRRSLMKALVLLLMLGAIVYFQRHADGVAEQVNRTLGPVLGPAPAPPPRPPQAPVHR